MRLPLFDAGPGPSLPLRKILCGGWEPSPTLLFVSIGTKVCGFLCFGFKYKKLKKKHGKRLRIFLKKFYKRNYYPEFSSKKPYKYFFFSFSLSLSSSLICWHSNTEWLKYPEGKKICQDFWHTQYSKHLHRLQHGIQLQYVQEV